MWKISCVGNSKWIERKGKEMWSRKDEFEEDFGWSGIEDCVFWGNKGCVVERGWRIEGEFERSGEGMVWG